MTCTLRTVYATAQNGFTQESESTESGLHEPASLVGWVTVSPSWCIRGVWPVRKDGGFHTRNHFRNSGPEFAPLPSPVPPTLACTLTLQPPPADQSDRPDASEKS